METFQRARSDEQRLIRRQTILRAAIEMLKEMPVSAITLNELSRRVGLAKSNVLRYFETREAVLLELLAQLAADFLAQAEEALPSGIHPGDAPSDRARSLSHGLTTALEEHPMLCELLSAQAGVLEHNVTTPVAARYKQAARESTLRLADLIQQSLPELDRERADRGATLAVILIGALWSHSHPAKAVQDAYDADPELALFNTPFPAAFEHAVDALLVGLLIETERETARATAHSTAEPLESVSAP
ncbi:TetR/AcrR family transcriptional regulator [Luteimicrobium xylanilyticum]|nr:TetR family transcriptional regulator [Luteimicrobium xylanilyticum]